MSNSPISPLQVWGEVQINFPEIPYTGIRDFMSPTGVEIQEFNPETQTFYSLCSPCTEQKIENSAGTCPTCFEQVHADNSCVTINGCTCADGVYHYDCIQLWFRTQANQVNSQLTCPLCRTEAQIVEGFDFEANPTERNPVLNQVLQISCTLFSDDPESEQEMNIANGSNFLSN